VAFTCGDIDGEELIERSASSRIALCQAHFSVAMSHLAVGERAEARKHFQSAARLKVQGYLEEAMSRSFLVQLERDQQWPMWIPKR
jgi:hypothetical protein